MIAEKVPFCDAALAERIERAEVRLVAEGSDAVTAGCDLPVVATQPGSTSQQNAQRHGFDLLYTRAILVNQP